MTRNQTKTEPFPASATEAEAETPGEPDTDTAVGRSVAGGQEAPGTSEQLPVVQGVHVPDVEEPDTRG